jgi:hypothetical protein
MDRVAEIRVPLRMETFSTEGSREKSRRSKELSIDARGVGWLGLLLRRSHRFRNLQYGLLFAGTFLACPEIGRSVTILWDASGTNVAGYRLYYGTSPLNYPFVIDVGPTTSCSVSNLVLAPMYFFAVTAYSHSGEESSFSSELVFISRLQITSIFTDAYGTVLNWPSAPGALYRILATQTLTDPVWVDVSGPLFAVSTNRLWTHIKPTSDGCMFYRVESISGAR